MSTDLAITAVTRTLRQILDDDMADKWGGDVLDGDLVKSFSVTAVLPQNVRQGNDKPNVVNIFLYRTELNAAWRNMPLPSQTKPGESGASPLALNLEYLITAYGEEDREDAAHFFLAQAMRVLHDRAILPRSAFKTVLPKARVHLQIEQVTITPKPLSIEEMSKLWSIFQVPFRVSTAYLVTVLLIDSRAATKSAPPVLRRGPQDDGVTALASAPPVLDFARPATGFSAVRLNEELVIHGERLDAGGLSARLHHPMLAAPIEVPVTPVDVTQVRIAIPEAVAGSGVSLAWPAGIYSLALVVTRPGMSQWATNDVPFSLAPTITVAPPTRIVPPANPFEVTLVVTPQIRENQSVIAIWDGEQFAPKSIATLNDPDASTTVKFDAPPDLGMHRVRLRVDGVDSIPIKTAGDLLEFDRDQSIEVKNP